MQITFLGTGTSQGVPIVGCKCKVCQSTNPKDKRLRCSIHIQQQETAIVIDTGPDFRQQLLQNKIDDIDAIVFTHEHKDHVAGLDDVRPINFLQEKDMPIYAEQRVLNALKNEFHYAFAAKKYPGVPNLVQHCITTQPFSIGSMHLQPIRVLHHKLPVLGFRINNFAYITDANSISAQEQEKLRDLDVLVLNALRREDHLSHFTLSEALQVIEQLAPKQAYLIHLSHQMGLHNELECELPNRVSVAFDGLKIQIPDK